MAELKKVFTETFITSVTSKATDQIYADKNNTNLKLYVRSSGSKSYYFRGKINGKDVKRRIGDIKEVSLALARVLAENYLKDRTSHSPQLKQLMPEISKELTVDQVFELYKANELKHRKTIAGRAHGFEVAYRTHLKDKLGEKRVVDISKKYARNFFLELGDKGYGAHNKALSAIKAAFNYVIDYEDNIELEVNPFDRVKKMQGVVRNRYLTHKEAGLLFEALEKVNDQDVADIYRLALFTGARLTNVKSMEWKDLNLNSAVWLIPSTRTKTSQHYEIPLHDIAINILSKRQKRVGINRFVFPARVKSKHGYITGGDSVWKEAIKMAGLYHANPNIRPRPHDLRRTFATWQIQSGADISVVSKALCHTSLKHTVVYAHTNVEQVRSAIDGAFDFLNYK